MMDSIKQFIDYVLHIDQHLIEWVREYHQWTYLIIFAIIFCETGLVILPFLPGDSLLFAAGIVCATGALDIKLLVLGIMGFAILGDNCNYYIGNYLSKKIEGKNYKYIKQEHLTRTELFFEKHGGKALILARFIPILRTFAPFVAGTGKMTYKRFLTFCVLGNILWVNLFAWAGYIFANNNYVKNNFSKVILAIIFVSFIPVLITLWKARNKKKKTEL